MSFGRYLINTPNRANNGQIRGIRESEGSPGAVNIVKKLANNTEAGKWNGKGDKMVGTTTKALQPASGSLTKETSVFCLETSRSN